MRPFRILFLIACLAFAQERRPTRKVSGLVLNVEGRPVVSARIDHAGKFPGTFITDGNGHFEISTDSPVVVIRRNGFQSSLLRTENATNVRVVLEPAQRPAACALEKPPKFTTRSGRDIDYTSTTYVIRTPAGQHAISCGSGPNWSSGVPSDDLVQRSVEYFEQMTGIDGDDFGLIDAHGKTKDGSYWRYRGSFGSSCSYRDVDQATARALDCVMPE